MSGSRRGQNSLELVVLFSFLLIVFFGFSAVIQEKIREQNDANRQDAYVQLADMVEAEILLATRTSTGYMRAFSLPTVLANEPYNATLEDSETLVITGNSSHNQYLRFLSVNVTLVPATPTQLPSTVIIEKNESGLFIRNDCASLDACS